MRRKNISPFFRSFVIMEGKHHFCELGVKMSTNPPRSDEVRQWFAPFVIEEPDSYQNKKEALQNKSRWSQALTYGEKRVDISNFPLAPASVGTPFFQPLLA